MNVSILGRARKDKKIEVSYQSPRDCVAVPEGAGEWAYKKVDERPYGGGPGMVMLAMPVIRAVAAALGRGDFVSPGARGLTKSKHERTKYGFTKPVIVWFRPSGKQFTNKDADTLAKYSDVVLVCGRYEGIDERGKKIVKTLAPIKEYAVGEAVYTGGELPAMAIVDAVTRRLPGVLGKDASVEERRVASSAVYTRPEVITFNKKNYRVPKVLKTGNHARINAWRANTP